MPAGLDKLFSSSGIYFLAGAGQQAVGFLLLPLYTNVLSPADYGVLEILNTTGLIALMIFNLGLPSAIMKCYHRDCRSDDDRRSILTTALAIAIPFLVVGCALLILFANEVTAVLIGPAQSSNLVRLMAAWVFVNTASGLVLALFRAREEAILLGTMTLGMFVLLMFLNICFVWALQLGVQGVLLGNCVATATSLAVSLVLLRGRAASRVQFRLVGPLLGFGVFIVPVALTGWVMGMADRYLLKDFGHLAAVGVYGLGYKLGMVMDVLVVSPFQLAWPAFAFAISRDADHHRTYARALTYLTLASTAGVLALTWLSPIVLRYATHADYHEAYTVVPFIALAYAFSGVHYCVSPGIHISRRTKWLPLIVSASAALNVALCVLLIPRFGILGAAWATAGAFALLAMATFALAQWVYPIRYEYRRLLAILGAGAALHAVSLVLSIDHPVGKTLLALVLLLVGYPVLLMIAGFPQPDELAALRRVLRMPPVHPWPVASMVRKSGAER